MILIRFKRHRNYVRLSFSPGMGISNESNAVIIPRSGSVGAVLSRFFWLLEHDQIEQAGTILWLGHAGLRDEYEVSCAELDALVEIARQVPGVLGARMMGGVGGCTINLVRSDAVELLRQLVEEEYPRRCGRRASVDIGRASAGPG